MSAGSSYLLLEHRSFIPGNQLSHLQTFSPLSIPADPNPSLVPGATTEHQLQNSLHPPTSSQHLLLHFIPQLQQILSPNLKADVFITTGRLMADIFLSNYSWDPTPPGSPPDL